MCIVKTMNIGGKTFKVADIKQKYMNNIVEAANDCDIIDRVVLFGSSTGEHCKETSDIDLAIFGKQTPSRALSSKKYERFVRRLYSYDNHAQAYDLLYFRTGAVNKSRIMEDIDKGEIVYER